MTIPMPDFHRTHLARRLVDPRNGCTGCGEPTPGNPSLCAACARERATHRSSKAIHRAADWRARTTKETTR